MSKPLRYRRASADPESAANAQAEMARLSAAGVRLLREGNVGDAIPLLKQAHAIGPRDYDVALNLSAAYILAGKFRSATPILEELKVRFPDRPQVWTNLGAAYLGNPVLADDDRQLRAIDAFKRALALDPIAHSVAYNIGLVYRDRREYEQAGYWFGQAVEHDPDDQHARRQLQRILEMDQE
jgi:tetratricopeptide (TPR) repeat protein